MHVTSISEAIPHFFSCDQSTFQIYICYFRMSEKDNLPAEIEVPVYIHAISGLS